MDLSRMSDVEGDLDGAVAGEKSRGITTGSPAPRTRSLSDGGAGTPRLSPSPHIVEASRRQSKDDIAIRDKDHEHMSSLPSTPIRTTAFAPRGLSLHMPGAASRDSGSPASATGHIRPAPPSPKLDHMYVSGTNILPRRSRGLDFSRAATSLHHSTLADPASPDSSPTIGSRAMAIPPRRPGEYGGPEQALTSLWSMMGNQERMHISSSVGSTSHAVSDLSSSSDDDDYMDEDMDDAYITTPQVAKHGTHSAAAVMGAPWVPGSPAVNSPASFQQRQRQRKLPKTKPRGPIGLGFHPTNTTPALTSKSPPNNLIGASDMSLHARRESISWAANQLHISGNESDDNHNRQLDGMDNSPLRPSIVRRTVTRRGNLLPKPKGFARIRAALAEEGAPIESEFRREAEVVRQVRESDMDLEPRPLPPQSVASTALSSPTLGIHDSLDELADDMMMVDPGASTLGLTGTLRQQGVKNTKGKVFWDSLSESSSMGATQRVTPPPPAFLLGRTSSSGLSLEDASMGSPSAASSNGGGASQGYPFALPGGGGNGTQTTASSSGNGTPLAPPTIQGNNNNNLTTTQPQRQPASGLYHTTLGGLGIPLPPTTTTMPIPIPTPTGPPTAAEITRRINAKRRRGGDDDLDPVSIKRRAVSPGMSVHNSPVMQSPLQRDTAPWGHSGAVSSGSRPGSVGGDSTAGGHVGGGGGRNNNGGGNSGGSGSGAPSENGSVYNGGGGGSGRAGVGGQKGRIGFQGMVDTNDGITKLSIE